MRRLTELPRDRELVVACQIGERSRIAARQLLALGFARTGWLEGGLFKWARRGLPLRPGRPACYRGNSSKMLVQTFSTWVAPAALPV